jgi:hypothetical protein
MKTVQQAHAAGKRDGEQGLGPLAPRNGPAGSQAHRLHAAYMQSYRDALVARVGVRSPTPRGKNARPRRKTVVPRRAARRAPRGKTVTTVSQSKVIRRTTNRRALYVLYASKRGHPRLKYLGRGKFGTRGPPRMFQSIAEGNAVGRALVDTFPNVLQGWTVTAGEDTPPPSGAPQRRRLRQGGNDPAEAIYRDQARRDTDAGHRWYARQKK